jgi:hypothetical protein
MRMAVKSDRMATDARVGRIFCFGLGYSASVLTESLRAEGWAVGGTARRPERLAELRARGIDAVGFEQPPDLSGVSHVLLSIPPGPEGDPVLSLYRDRLATAPVLRWIGYLSTTGVYGDHGGDWVDETTPLKPGSERTRRRAAAEQDWLAFGTDTGIRTQIFRLAGIYGPGRSVFDDIKAGTAKRIVRPGQMFSRIHVADITNILHAAMNGGSDATIFNVCDDEPAASADVVTYACRLLGVKPPPEIAFDQAELSPMALSFWADNKRVRNDLLKKELGVSLLYPSYREGLNAARA